MKRTTKILLSSVSTLLVLVVFGGVAFAQGADSDASVKLHGLAQNYGWIALAALNPLGAIRRLRRADHFFAAPGGTG